ncbi:MAG: CNNM domain-containing protein [Lentisphaerota bacterium]
MIYLIAGLMLAVLMHSFFCGCEIGLISSQKPRIRSLVRRGSKSAAIIEFFLERPHLMLATILIGVNIALSIAADLAKEIALECGFRDNWTTMFITASALAVILLIFEIIPKDWFRQAPEERCVRFARMFYAFYLILYVPAVLLAKFTAWFINTFSNQAKSADNAKLLLREDFRILLRDSESAGIIENEAAEIIDRSLDFYNLRVGSIMIPISKVKTVPHNATVREAVELCRRHRLSRLLIKNENLTDIDQQFSAIFSIYDAIFKLNESKWHDTPVTACSRTPATIRPHSELNEVLTRTKAAQCQLVVVRNDNNTPIGIVTPVDVVKRLFP